MYSIQETSGLGGEEVDGILGKIAEFVNTQEEGTLMCLQLIEIVLSHLDDLNTKAECSICKDGLFGSENGGGAMRTVCFHVFHIPCLGEWWIRKEKEEADKKVSFIYHPCTLEYLVPTKASIKGRS